MRRIVTGFVSVICTFFRFCLLKILHPKTLRFHCVERFSPNVVVEMEKGGALLLGKNVRAHSGCIFKLRSGGVMNIGDAVSFNYNCMLFCREKIEICEGVEFGPNVMVYDHDHDFRCSGGIKEEQFNSAPIYIGRNVWIGCNTIILKGTIIGENAVIAAGSVVKGEVPPNSVYIQKRDKEIVYYGK